MRNLLIIVKLLILTAFVAQSPDTTILKNDGQKTEKPVQVEKEINTLLKQGAAEIEEIKKIKEKNDQEIQNIQKIELKEKSLWNSISKNVEKLLIKKNKTVVEPIYIQNDKNKISELTSLKTDSVCVSYKRKDVFSKSKCSQWEYYTYIVDSNNKKIIIK